MDAGDWVWVWLAVAVVVRLPRARHPGPLLHDLVRRGRRRGGAGSSARPRGRCPVGAVPRLQRARSRCSSRSGDASPTPHPRATRSPKARSAGSGAPRWCSRRSRPDPTPPASSGSSAASGAPRPTAMRASPSTPRSRWSRCGAPASSSLHRIREPRTRGGFHDCHLRAGSDRAAALPDRLEVVPDRASVPAGCHRTTRSVPRDG